jgi:hypothetical protein
MRCGTGACAALNAREPPQAVPGSVGCRARRRTDDGDRRVGLLPFIGPSRPSSFESADDNVPVPDDAGSHSRQEVPRADPVTRCHVTPSEQDERLIAEVRDVFRLARQGGEG